MEVFAFSLLLLKSSAPVSSRQSDLPLATQGNEIK